MQVCRSAERGGGGGHCMRGHLRLTTHIDYDSDNFQDASTENLGVAAEIESFQWWDQHNGGLMNHRCLFLFVVHYTVSCELHRLYDHACQYIQFNCWRYLHVWSKPQNHYYNTTSISVIVFNYVYLTAQTKLFVQQSIIVHAWLYPNSMNVNMEVEGDAWVNVTSQTPTK